MIDLHTHSTASDGLLAPADLIRHAHEVGITTLALTDHDTTNGLQEARAAGATHGIAVIPGVEINTDLPDQPIEIHILGYFIDCQNRDFQLQLSHRRSARERRARRIVAQLQQYGIPLTWELVSRHVKGTIGRPHIAEALMDLGVTKTVSEGFDKYLSRGMPGYVPREPFTPVQAIHLARLGQGIPVLAHPGGITNLADILPDLVEAGLAGIEVYYGSYDDLIIERLLDLCHQFSLVPTGGSDYHGPNMHPTPLGGRSVPDTSLAMLRELAGSIAKNSGTKIPRM
jgi:3',5'-nucleoside bisphosphate phosphatase